MCHNAWHYQLRMLVGSEPWCFFRSSCCIMSVGTRICCTAMTGTYKRRAAERYRSLATYLALMARLTPALARFAGRSCMLSYCLSATAWRKRLSTPPTLLKRYCRRRGLSGRYSPSHGRRFLGERGRSSCCRCLTAPCISQFSR